MKAKTRPLAAIFVFATGSLLASQAARAQIDFSSLNQWRGLGNQRPSFQNPGVNNQQIQQAQQARQLADAAEQKKKDDEAAAAAAAEQQRQDEANAFNDQGVADYNSKDFAAAGQLFLKFLQMYPGNPVVLNNLAGAKCGLGIAAESRGDYAESAADLQGALDIESGLTDPTHDKEIRANLQLAKNMLEVQKEAENAHNDALKREAKDRDVSTLINKIAANYSQTLTAAPANGVDINSFDSSSANTQGDPATVDARNVPSGLPKPVDNAIAGAFHGASPDAIDRIRKGMQAVMTKDWKVANAWFEDALNHDPGNAQLQQLVKTFQDATQTPGAPGFPTGDKTKSAINPADEDKELRAFTTGTDAGWRDRARANRQALEDALEKGLSSP